MISRHEGVGVATRRAGRLGRRTRHIPHLTLLVAAEGVPVAGLGARGVGGELPLARHVEEGRALRLVATAVATA